MNLRPLDWLGWLLALVVWAGFFLPWVKLPSGKKPPLANAPAIVKALTSDSNRSPLDEYFYVTPDEWKRAIHDPATGVSGLDIPRVYKTPSRGVEAMFLSASGLFGDKRQSDRAVFVFAFPVVALLSTAFVTAVARKWALLLPLAASAALYGYARHILADTYLQRLALSVDIGLGLWLSLYALLGLIVVVVLRLLLPAHSRI